MSDLEGFSFDDSVREEIEDEFDVGFESARDVDAAGQAGIDVAESQEEIDEEIDAIEKQVETNEDGAADTAENRDKDEDGDYLEYARHCQCGASFRSKSAFNEHVDDVRNGTGVCPNSVAADGGAIANTPTTTAPTPSIEPGEKPTIPKLTTAEQMLKLEEDEQERFAFLMQFCLEVHQGERPRRRVLSAIVGGDGPSYAELAEIAGMGDRTVKKYVKELRDAGIIVTQGQGSPSTSVVFDKWTMEALAAHALSRTKNLLGE